MKAFVGLVVASGRKWPGENGVGPDSAFAAASLFRQIAPFATVVCTCIGFPVFTHVIPFYFELQQRFYSATYNWLRPLITCTDRLGSERTRNGQRLTALPRSFVVVLLITSRRL
jgi:hypothetical protein